jgi:ferredoxin-NAD(P)+ reductase (naphthalene dioxygenase ferredoxin-specific)
VTAHRVRLESFDREILVQAGATILSAALDEGIDYPFMCTQGQCGACKSQLIRGEVYLGTLYNPMVLTERERACGKILACQAEPRGDCVIATGTIGGMEQHLVRELQCVVTELERPVSGVTIIRLRSVGEEFFPFTAGQYAELGFAGMPPRLYSMANRPDERTLEFHIRKMTDGQVSRFVGDRLACGDRVVLKGPYGTAGLQQEHLGPILLAAAGTGLAPIQSILETALSVEMAQPIQVYVGARSAQDLYHEERLRALARQHANIKLEIVLSQSTSTDSRRTSISDAIKADLADLSAYQAYIAGPPGFCNTTRQTLDNLGLGPDACFMDPFLTHTDDQLMEQ